MKALSLPGDLAKVEETKKGSYVLTRMLLRESGFALLFDDGRRIFERQREE